MDFVHKFFVLSNERWVFYCARLRTWADIQRKASRSFGPLFPSMASISRCSGGVDIDVIRVIKSPSFLLRFCIPRAAQSPGPVNKGSISRQSFAHILLPPGVLPPECCKDTLQYLQQRGPSTLFWSSTTGPACTSMPPETRWHECKSCWILVNFFLYIFKAYIKFVPVVYAIL